MDFSAKIFDPILDKHLSDAQVMRLAAKAALGVSIGLVAIKMVGYFATGSLSLLATLADSLSDIVASLGTYIGIRTALAPADAEHRYGHGKAEAMAALGTAAFVLGSASFLVVEGIDRVLDPQPLHTSSAGIIVMLFSMLLTFALVQFQKYAVRRTNSVALAADETHYTADFLSNGAVILALLLTAWTGFSLIDAFFAFAIAGWLVWQVVPVAKNAVNMLMDRELDDSERENILTIARSHPQVSDVHDLRTRRSGSDIFIELHIELPPDMKLRLAHAVGDQVELAIRKTYPQADVMIHFDPEGIEEPKLDQQIAG
jgi:ferrous-iron efflux pump FieF